MTTRLVQPPGSAPGSASLQIIGAPVDDPAAIELAIIQIDSVECYLDP